MELLEEYEEIYSKILEKEDSDKINKPYKISGNIFAYFLKQNIAKILKNRYELSVVNSFIKGCNIEWDLLILKKGSLNSLNYNIYSPEQVICALEFKTSGIICSSESNEITSYMDRYFDIIKELNKRHKTNIKYGYISLCESRKSLEIMKNKYLNNCFWIKEGTYKSSTAPINKRKDLERFINNLIK